MHFSTQIMIKLLNEFGLFLLSSILLLITGLLLMTTKMEDSATICAMRFRKINFFTACLPTTSITLFAMTPS